MRKGLFATLIMLCVLGVMIILPRTYAAGPSSAPAENVPAALEEVFEENLRATEAEDIKGAMSGIHPKSPVYAATRGTLLKLGAAYDLHYEILSSKYIGMDGEYAVMRVKQKTSKVKGPKFRNNVLDAMHIFKKDGAKWKIWQSAILSVEFIDKPGSPSKTAQSSADSL